MSFDHPMQGIYTVAPNGRTYASHEFGNTLFLLPTAFVNHLLSQTLTRAGMSPERIELAENFVMSFQAGLYVALILAFLYHILNRVYGQPSRTAFLACCVLAFTSFLWTYSRELFDGVLASLLMIASLWFLLRFRDSGAWTAEAAAFALLGLAVDTRLSMVVFVVASLYFVLAHGPKPRVQSLLIAGLALAPFALWQVYYNHLRTGNPLLSPVQTPQYAFNNALDGNLAEGLLGLILSPGKGLFVYAPVLLISVLVFPRFARKDRAVATYILIAAALWLLLHARLRSWYGAWGLGPRHMITILPLLAIPALVHLPKLGNRTWSRWASALLLVPGFLLALASITGNYHHRLELASLRGYNDSTFIWGLHNQAVDMLESLRHILL
ncbi:MAG TPA: glycosyltransferase family 39 protein, partial [Isosphaeraceae bacterium]|nr:glycosyltransferase family 39 protein [Isosphaeraceae bacterium]